VNVARAGYYPKITGGATAGYDNNNRGGWRPQMDLRASQMLYDFGKVSGSVDAARSGEAVSRAQLLQAVDNLVRDTASVLIEVQRYRDSLKVAREQLASIEIIAMLVRNRNTEGASTRSDRVQAEARVEAAESTILELSAQLSRWESALSSLLGSDRRLDVSPDVPAWLSKACAMPEPDWPEAPAVMQAEAQRNQAAAQLKRSKADQYPTIALEAGAGYDFNRQTYDSSTGTTPDNARFTVGLNISSSVYDGGATGAKQDAANAALRAADAARGTARLQLKRALAEANSQVGDLGRMLRSLGHRAEMMQETRELYRRQYFELGTRTLLDLLNAEQEFYAVQFENVRASHDLRRLWVDCLYNSGQIRKAFSLTGKSIRGVSL
jgi:adhesin transport system outer membrane protein